MSSDIRAGQSISAREGFLKALSQRNSKEAPISNTGRVRPPGNDSQSALPSLVRRWVKKNVGTNTTTPPDLGASSELGSDSMESFDEMKGSLPKSEFTMKDPSSLDGQDLQIRRFSVNQPSSSSSSSKNIPECSTQSQSNTLHTHSKTNPEFPALSQSESHHAHSKTKPEISSLSQPNSNHTHRKSKQECPALSQSDSLHTHSKTRPEFPAISQPDSRRKHSDRNIRAPWAASRSTTVPRASRPMKRRRGVNADMSGIAALFAKRPRKDNSQEKEVAPVQRKPLSFANIPTGTASKFEVRLLKPKVRDFPELKQINDSTVSTSVSQPDGGVPGANPNCEKCTDSRADAPAESKKSGRKSSFDFNKRSRRRASKRKIRSSKRSTNNSLGAEIPHKISGNASRKLVSGRKRTSKDLDIHDRLQRKRSRKFENMIVGKS
eukprot:910808_1